MEPADKAPFKLRVVLMWLLMPGVILFWVVFWLWKNHGHTAADDSAPGMVASHSLLSLFFGGFFLVAGVAAYLAAVFSGCFCFYYRRPVWQGAKVRLFLVNIVAGGGAVGPVGTGLCVGSVCQAGLVDGQEFDTGLASMLPVMLMIGGIQMGATLGADLVADGTAAYCEPVEGAGHSMAQLQNAFLVGLSDGQRTGQAVWVHRGRHGRDVGGPGPDYLLG